MFIEKIINILLSAIILFGRRILLTLLAWMITVSIIDSISALITIFINWFSLNLSVRTLIGKLMLNYRVGVCNLVDLLIILVFFNEGLWIINFGFIFLFIGLNTCIFLGIVLKCGNIFSSIGLIVLYILLIKVNLIVKKGFILLILFLFLNYFIISFLITSSGSLMTLILQVLLFFADAIWIVLGIIYIFRIA